MSYPRQSLHGYKMPWRGQPIQVLAIKKGDAPDQRVSFGLGQRVDGQYHLDLTS